MSATFAASLRTRAAEIHLAEPGPATIRVRVEMPEVWDVVRVVALPSDPVLTLKIRSIEALYPAAEFHDDFIVKFRGWEILDESVSLAEAGLVDGAIVLITFRRRRAVR